MEKLNTWTSKDGMITAYYKNKLLQRVVFFSNDEIFNFELNQIWRNSNWKKAHIVAIDERSGYIRYFTYREGFRHFETCSFKMFIDTYYKLWT